MSIPLLFLLFILVVLLFLILCSLLVKYGNELNPNADTAVLEKQTPPRVVMENAPALFSEFVGQTRAVELLKIHVLAAQNEEKCVPHVLLEGPGGTGKTTLAMCMANEVGSRFYVTTPSTFKDKDSVVNFFFDANGDCIIEDGDIIFIDEIHRLREAAAIYIYSAMQDFYMDVGNQIAELPRFTLIGATTDAGMLASPFRDRFKIRVALGNYTIPDLKDIVIKFKELKPEIALEIAKRSCGVPRLAKSISDNTIAVAIAENKNTITMECLERACYLLEIDTNGISKSARKVIKFFQENENQPIGISSLSNAINISRETIENEIYPMLFNQGLLTSKGTKGKCLTTKGNTYENETVKTIPEF